MRPKIRPLPIVDESDESVYMEFNPGNVKTDASIQTPDDSYLFGSTFIVENPSYTFSSDDKEVSPKAPIQPSDQQSAEKASLLRASEALQRASELDDVSLGSVFDEVLGIVDQLRVIKDQRVEKGSRAASSSGVSSGDGNSIESTPSQTSKKILEWEAMNKEVVPAIPPKTRNSNITIGPPGHTPGVRPVNLTRIFIRDSLSDLSTMSSEASPRTVRVRFEGVDEEKEIKQKEAGARPKSYLI